MAGEQQSRVKTWLLRSACPAGVFTHTMSQSTSVAAASLPTELPSCMLTLHKIEVTLLQASAATGLSHSCVSAYHICGSGQGHNIVAYGAYSMPAPAEGAAGTADSQMEPEEETVADLLARLPPTPSTPISPAAAKDTAQGDQGAQAGKAMRAFRGVRSTALRLGAGVPRTASAAQPRDLLDSSSEDSSSDLGEHS